MRVFRRGDHTSQFVDSSTCREGFASDNSVVGEVVIESDLLLQLSYESIFIMDLFLVDAFQLLLKSNTFLVALALDCLDFLFKILFLMVYDGEMLQCSTSPARKTRADQRGIDFVHVGFGSTLADV